MFGFNFKKEKLGLGNLKNVNENNLKEYFKVLVDKQKILNSNILLNLFNFLEDIDNVAHYRGYLEMIDNDIHNIEVIKKTAYFLSNKFNKGIEKDVLKNILLFIRYLEEISKILVEVKHINYNNKEVRFLLEKEVGVLNDVVANFNKERFY